VEAPLSVLVFESLDSTNDEAQRQAAGGARAPLWIVAREQTKGRGRGGRQWHSPAGNLYTSLLLNLSIGPAVATQLSFVAALAVHSAVSQHLAPSQLPGLKLKWPNDVVLDGAKLAGILIESASNPSSTGLTVIAGIGINVAAAPEGTGRAVASIGKPPQACAAVFEDLATAFESWYSRWDNGKDFAGIREAWLARAFALGQVVSVNLNGPPIQGTFRGVDTSGALQLETGPGVVITINAGDIYPYSQG
jgi:BirA family transcriptional regulator, biotin operon repressor / biotin---[acetyl-CoA-carboxylase] ligase